MSDSEFTTSALIPLHNHIFDDRTKPGVSARTLYEFLELIPTSWARWVKRNITANPYAIEHVDWESFQPPAENSINARAPGRPTKDYALSIDFSKRLAMMTRSPKGEEARAYFLECERLAQASQVPELHDPAYQLLVQTVIDLDMTRHQVALLVERERVRDQELIAAQQKMIEGFLMAERAEAKADVALEDVHRMTVEEYVIKNGLLRQYRQTEYQRISKWLSNFCQQFGLEVRKAPVLGKSWDSENAYPLQAFAAFHRYDQKRPQQITLVKEKRKEHNYGTE